MDVKRLCSKNAQITRHPLRGNLLESRLAHGRIIQYQGRAVSENKKTIINFPRFSSVVVAEIFSPSRAIQQAAEFDKQRKVRTTGSKQNGCKTPTREEKRRENVV